MNVKIGSIMGKLNKKITRTLSSRFTVNKFKCVPIEKEEITTVNKPLPEVTDTKVASIAENPPVISSKPENGENKLHQAKKDKSKKPKKKGQNSKFYMKCAKAREEKGMIILPAKIETKIYKLKKALQKKGLPGEEIKDIIRKKRREEELKMRKDLKHLCFKCRQPGHELANCPQAGSEDAADICYFCGSSEHRLHECVKYKSADKKDTNLPYAKCFICKKKGHLTKSCSQNENGVFPKGGKCILCGAVDHMVKDCSQNENKEKPEEEIILKTYGDVTQSIDADDFTFTLPEKAKSTNKNLKTVKF